MTVRFEQQRGLYKKYEVVKTHNPTKKIDCIVLEFDDPISRVGIKAWAREMLKAGYIQVAMDTEAKLRKAEENETR